MSPELLEAPRKGDVDIPRAGNPLFHITAGGNSVLHNAAKVGQMDLAKVAFKLQPSLLEHRNTRGDTPLHFAARAGHRDMVDFFISSYSSLSGDGDERVRSLVQTANNAGNTALHDAAQNCHESVVASLMGVAPGVSEVTNGVTVSPLYMAVESGSKPIVERLLGHKEASCQGPNGQTALHLAVLRNYEITKILVEKSPTLINKTESTGSAPVHFAASAGDLEMVKLLVEKDESTAYLQDSDGASALHLAARFGHLKVIQHLVQKCRESVELLDHRGRNFLHVAIEENRKRVVFYVLISPQFIDVVNETDKEGNTPLHVAVISQHILIVAMLSTNDKVKTSVINNDGHTALGIALSNANREAGFDKTMIISYLMQKGSKFSRQRLHLISGHLIKEKEKAKAGHLKKLEGEEKPKAGGHSKKLEQEEDNAVKKEGGDAKVEEYRKITENMSIVAVLIATVTYAAAFTLPGGYKSDQGDHPGRAMLVKKPAFKAFLILDAMAMISSIPVPILLIPSSHYLKDFKSSLASQLLRVAVVAFTLAFGCAIYVVVADECMWLAKLICVMVVGSIWFSHPVFFPFPPSPPLTLLWKANFMPLVEHVTKENKYDRPSV